MDILIKVAEFLLAAGSGALITFITFRIKLREHELRLTQHDAELLSHKENQEKTATHLENRLRSSVEILRTEMEERHEENRKSLHMMERRSMFTLKLIADVARKLGVDSRIDDVVIGFLTDDHEIVK